MNKVFETYHLMYQQGFVPIFVKDDFNTESLLEGCVAAGVKIIEYTLRRPDAKEMIPWIRKNYPDLKLVVGSTLDCDKIVNKLKKKAPQLMTLDELADIGVDGFVSMLKFSEDTIRKFSQTHLLVPSATTVNEAYELVCYGAHMVKMMGPGLDLVKGSRKKPVHDFCPIFVTGGMSPTAIPTAIDAGAVCIGSGFDLIMKGHSPDVKSEQIADGIKEYIQSVKESREATYPEMMRYIDEPSEQWLDSLPHYHPF